MRSRASGGICGDSSAAPSAETMSSLRRRAIWVQRARSTWRSSIGGRASARTTAGASAGIDQQPQPGEQVAHLGALEEGGVADEPVADRALLQRDRDRLALARDRAHEHGDPLRRHAFARDQPLDVGRDRLRLRALVGRAPEADLAAERPVEPLLDPVLQRRDDRGGRVEHPLRAAERVLEPHDASRPAARPGSRAGSSSRRRGSGWIAWSSSPAAVRLPCSEASSRSSRPWAKFGSCTSSTSRWRQRAGDARAHVRVLAQQRQRADHEVAAVERALLGEHPVVRLVDRGELTLAGAARALRVGCRALAALRHVVLAEASGIGPSRFRNAIGASRWHAELVGPGGVLVGADQLVLEAVDPAHEAGDERRRVAAEVVTADRQLVDPLQQHREPVGAADGDGERVEPAGERLLAQQPRAEGVHGRHRQLLVRLLDGVLDVAPQRVGGALGARQRQHRLRRLALLDQPREARDERARLAAAGAADDQQRPAAVGDGRGLSGERPSSTDTLQVCRRWDPLARRSTPTGSGPRAPRPTSCAGSCARRRAPASAPRRPAPAARAATARS